MQIQKLPFLRVLSDKPTLAALKVILRAGTNLMIAAKNLFFRAEAYLKKTKYKVPLAYFWYVYGITCIRWYKFSNKQTNDNIKR